MLQQKLKTGTMFPLVPFILWMILVFQFLCQDLMFIKIVANPRFSP